MPPDDPKLKTAPLGKSVESEPKFGIACDVVITVANSGSSGSFNSSFCIAQHGEAVENLGNSSRQEVQFDTAKLQDFSCIHVL